MHRFSKGENGLSPDSRDLPKNTLYYHERYDQSVTMMTDLNGKLLNRKIYQPYGAATGTQENSLRGFMGRESDTTIDSLNFGLRGYDVALGKFVAADTLMWGGPMAGSTSLNRYAFAGNDPVNNGEDGNKWWRHSGTGEIRDWGSKNPNEIQEGNGKTEKEEAWQEIDTKPDVKTRDWHWLSNISQETQSSIYAAHYQLINDHPNLAGPGSRLPLNKGNCFFACFAAVLNFFSDYTRNTLQESRFVTSSKAEAMVNRIGFNSDTPLGLTVRRIPVGFWVDDFAGELYFALRQYSATGGPFMLKLEFVGLKGTIDYPELTPGLDKHYIFGIFTPGVPGPQAMLIDPQGGLNGGLPFDVFYLRVKKICKTTLIIFACK